MLLNKEIKSNLIKKDNTSQKALLIMITDS